MSTKRLSVRKKLIVASAGTALLASFGVMSVLAVHGLNFQLDGDTDHTTTTSVNGTTQNIDWDSLIDSAGVAITPRPAGFTASGFDKDFVNTGTTFLTSDTTTFSTGSKDTLPISGWQCNYDNNVNSKIDVMNSYAAAYTDPATGDQIIYFGLERNTNTGDANVAFWFLQDDVNCATTGASQTFTGQHQDGDLLIVSAFTKGGNVSTITVYRWNRPGNPVGVPGSLGTTPVASGVDCRDPNTDANDTACAAANTAGITVPWLTANFKQGVGNTLQTGEFFEGGLNLTKSNLGGKCFNVFIGDTRSSQSLTATLFDYARGKLGECGVTVTTTPSSGSYTLGSGASITDTADVSGTSSGGGTGPTPTGTVSFFLCGPGVTSCTSGGAPIPSDPAAAVTLGACDPVAAGHACATSADAHLLITTVGTYCFRAVYDPGTDPNYAGKGGSFDGSNECFTVGGNATLATAQRWTPNDTAHITSPTGTTLSGNVTFNLYNSGTCAAPGTAVYGPIVIDVTTGTGAANDKTVSTNNTTTFVVTTANDEVAYFWKVSYDDGSLGDPAAVCETTSAFTVSP
jgi:hypothetical protein